MDKSLIAAKLLLGLFSRQPVEKVQEPNYASEAHWRRTDSRGEPLYPGERE